MPSLGSLEGCVRSSEQTFGTSAAIGRLEPRADLGVERSILRNGRGAVHRRAPCEGLQSVLRRAL